MARWLEVELLATEALAEIGIVPREDAATIRAKAAFTVDAVNEREKVTDHDVAAFVDVVQESVGMPSGAALRASSSNCSSRPSGRPFALKSELSK